MQEYFLKSFCIIPFKIFRTWTEYKVSYTMDHKIIAFSYYYFSLFFRNNFLVNVFWVRSLLWQKICVEYNNNQYKYERWQKERKIFVHKNTGSCKDCHIANQWSFAIYILWYILLWREWLWNNKYFLFFSFSNLNIS